MIVWSKRAQRDVNRFAAFLRDHHPQLAEGVAAALIDKLSRLDDMPRLGRPIANDDVHRRLVVNALNAAYLVDYRIEGDVIRILRVRHGREAR